MRDCIWAILEPSVLSSQFSGNLEAALENALINEPNQIIVFKIVLLFDRIGTNLENIFIWHDFSLLKGNRDIW